MYKTNGFHHFLRGTARMVFKKVKNRFVETQFWKPDGRLGVTFRIPSAALTTRNQYSSRLKKFCRITSIDATRTSISRDNANKRCMAKNTLCIGYLIEKIGGIVVFAAGISTTRYTHQNIRIVMC